MPRKSPHAALELPRRSWVEIDHGALKHNLKIVRKLAGKAGLIAVVKANAYGHGLNEVVASLSKGVSVFAVASLGEALQLRQTDQETPILLLSAALSSEYREIARHGFIPTLSSLDEARLFAKAASTTKRRGAAQGSHSPVHLKINTGMGRLGAHPSEIRPLLRSLLKLPLSLHSISTHLPSADSDSAFTATQLRHFKSLVEEVRSLVPDVPAHALNSAGTILHPEHSHDFVRVGLLLYGISPLKEIQHRLQPVLSWKAAVTHLNEIPKGHGISYGGSFVAPKKLRVAVLPAGYADGYPRQLSGKGACVLIRGNRCPVLGRVTMDQIIVDVSGTKGVKLGDEAVLVGSQGKEEITATQVAEQADTIPWHLFCGITARVTYVHRKLNGKKV